MLSQTHYLFYVIIIIISQWEDMHIMFRTDKINFIFINDDSVSYLPNLFESRCLKLPVKIKKVILYNKRKC